MLKKWYVLKNFGPKLFIDNKNNLNQFWVQQNLGAKNFLLKKRRVQKFHMSDQIWYKKILVKQDVAENILGFVGSIKFWVKNGGPKLAKKNWSSKEKLEEKNYNIGVTTISGYQQFGSKTIL